MWPKKLWYLTSLNYFAADGMEKLVGVGGKREELVETDPSVGKVMDAGDEGSGEKEGDGGKLEESKETTPKDGENDPSDEEEKGQDPPMDDAGNGGGSGGPGKGGGGDKKDDDDEKDREEEEEDDEEEDEEKEKDEEEVKANNRPIRKSATQARLDDNLRKKKEALETEKDPMPELVKNHTDGKVWKETELEVDWSDPKKVREYLLNKFKECSDAGDKSKVWGNQMNQVEGSYVAIYQAVNQTGGWESVLNLFVKLEVKASWTLTDGKAKHPVAEMIAAGKDMEASVKNIGEDPPKLLALMEKYGACIVVSVRECKFQEIEAVRNGSLGKETWVPTCVIKKSDQPNGGFGTFSLLTRKKGVPALPYLGDVLFAEKTMRTRGLDNREAMDALDVYCKGNAEEIEGRKDYMMNIWRNGLATLIAGEKLSMKKDTKVFAGMDKINDPRFGLKKTDAAFKKAKANMAVDPLGGVMHLTNMLHKNTEMLMHYGNETKPKPTSPKERLLKLQGQLSAMEAEGEDETDEYKKLEAEKKKVLAEMKKEKRLSEDGGGKRPAKRAGHHGGKRSSTERSTPARRAKKPKNREEDEDSETGICRVSFYHGDHIKKTGSKVKNMDRPLWKIILKSLPQEYDEDGKTEWIGVMPLGKNGDLDVTQPLKNFIVSPKVKKMELQTGLEQDFHGAGEKWVPVNVVDKDKKEKLLASGVMGNETPMVEIMNRWKGSYLSVNGRLVEDGNLTVEEVMKRTVTQTDWMIVHVSSKKEICIDSDEETEFQSDDESEDGEG